MKSNLKSSDQIREYAWMRYIEPARHNAGTTVRIKAGDIVKGLRLKNKTPNVCSALRSKIFQELYGVQLVEEQGPPSGMSTTVIFTYKVLNRIENKGNDAVLRTGFIHTRGLAKKVFESLHGGESFIRGERKNFYEKIDGLSQGKRG